MSSREVVAEVAGLLGAAGRGRGRVEVHDDLAALEVGELDGVAVGVGQAERGRVVAHLEAGVGGMRVLVEQVEVPVLPADVDDERDRGTQLRDVREVLFGADADVDAAARLDPAGVLGDPRLVRHEVVGDREEPAGSDSDSPSARNSASLIAAGSVEGRHAATASASTHNTKHRVMGSARPLHHETS